MKEKYGKVLHFGFQKLQMIRPHSKMGQPRGGGREVGIVLFCPCQSQVFY